MPSEEAASPQLDDPRPAPAVFGAILAVPQDFPDVLPQVLAGVLQALSEILKAGDAARR